MTVLPLPDVRLSFVAEIANGLLVLVGAALEPTVRGRPERMLLGHATPPDDCCDYISVVFTGFRASSPGVTAAQRLIAERCGDVDFAAEVAITVARSGAPTVARASRRGSSADDLLAGEARLAEELMEDAVALMQRATPAIPVFLRQLVAFQWLQPPSYTPGRLTPFSQGGCAGWVCQGTLSLPAPPPAPAGFTTTVNVQAVGGQSGTGL